MPLILVRTHVLLIEGYVRRVSACSDRGPDLTPAQSVPSKLIIGIPDPDISVRKVIVQHPAIGRVVDHALATRTKDMAMAAQHQCSAVGRVGRAVAGDIGPPTLHDL